MKDLARGETSDLTRLSVSEGLISTLENVDVAKELFDLKTTSGTVDKQIERLLRSALVIALDQDHFKPISLG